MADVIRKATNRFTKGLIMDFSPENTKNELLTHALNATLLTFNGNELSLQNDMGNGRVETAYLPEGYMPVGTCEYGGIIYIVSYNPLEDKSLIGCFPSPERNISSDELGISDVKIDREFFQKFTNGFPDSSGTILHNTQYVLLKNDNLNPGDKFLICANKEIYNEKITDLLVDKDDKYYFGNSKNNPNGYESIHNPVIALNVVSIEESGKIVYLNSDIRQYEVTNSYNIDGQQYTDTYKYHILGQMAENEGTYNQATIDPDDYRNVLSSGYSVFKSKTSGRLAILAELVMIDSYSVTHSIYPRKDEHDNIVEGTFDIVIHTEIEPLLNKSNYYTAPKLQYYYLDNSLGYIQTKNEAKRPLFLIDDKGINTGKYNGTFFSTKLSDIYEPIVSNITSKLNTDLNKSGNFNFPKPYTYHGRMIPYYGEVTGTADDSIYTKFTEGKYHRIDYSQISTSTELIKYYKEDVRAKFYYYEPSGKEYQLYTEEEINTSYTYYTREPDHIYTDVKRNTDYKNQTLYKLISIPLVATDEQLENLLVEKFQYLDIHSYQEATEKDIETADKLYYTEDGGKTYISTVQPVVGVTYYILITERNLISLGFTIDKNTLKGEAYYFPSEKTYEQATEEDKNKYYDFNTYPYESTEPYGSPLTLYLRTDNWKYNEATENEIYNYKDLGIELYYSTNYVLIPEIEYYRKENLVFIVVPMDTYVDSTLFVPNVQYNWIYGKDKPSGEYPKDDEIYLYTLADFIPDNIDAKSDHYLTYGDIRLGNIQLPNVVSLNGLDLPFKYDYTVVPCMNYGKLQHLAVSNTVDFSKLHAFNQSDFTTWKYRIDDNQLRLTFGAEVFDTYETNKVDGLVLEFYDCWGFAGSLEIVDKKSYSGIFTKLIPLNSLRALSRKKVTANGYSENYVRNINIKEEFDLNGNVVGFTFNGENAVYLNSTNGWHITDKSLSDPSETVDNNDCGTLYSNVLYGVKTYLRRTAKDGKEFIKKSDFFLYTLPIYNEFYYTVPNFNNLQEPELDLMLTYKLKDNSSRSVYTREGIVNGLNTADNTKVSNYLSGFYDKSELDLIKYYMYKGHTDLYLEIGLKKDYELLNLSYSPEINNYFSCGLWLVSNEDETKLLTVNSGVEGLTEVGSILNYHNAEFELDSNIVNKFGFDSDYKNNISVSKENFKTTNFITHLGESPIKINYEFVVGYTAAVLDIRSTQVQATTVCALYHKKPDGEYNHEDFGVYIQSENGEDKYLSSVMFYNEGTKEKEVFGVCKQIKTSGTNMLDECQSITSVETDAQEIKTAGKLNTGEPLQQLVSNIGKLTFCQPHAHGLSESNGVNIYSTNGGTLGVAPEYGDWMVRDEDWMHDNDYDDCYGIVPTDILFKSPKYNMCLNTKNTINYYSEFLSTLDYNTTTGKIYGYDTAESVRAWSSDLTMREYTGFSGKEISDFNKKLLNTMSSIYAYNPDYDQLTVNVGNISLLNYNPSFTSNLISNDSKLTFNEGQSLNDFIYFGPIKVTNYLQYLHNNSIATDGSKIAIKYTDKFGTTKFLPLLLFIPNYDYCGTRDVNCLISSLTYNTPVPKELETELEFSSSNLTVIKHSNGENSFLDGTPNKKALYGYNKEYNKMIELDVSNYTIDIEGNLAVTNSGVKEYKKDVLEVTPEINQTLYTKSHKLVNTFTNTNGELIDLDVSISLDTYGAGFTAFKCDEDSFMIGGQFSTLSPESLGFTLNPYINVYSTVEDDNKTFSAKITEIEFECVYNILNDECNLYGGPIDLSKQLYDTLQALAEGSYNLVTFVNTNGSTFNAYPSQYIMQSHIATDIFIMANDRGISSYGINSIPVNSNGEVNLNVECNFIINPEEYPYLMFLMEIRIKKIKYTITLTSKLENSPVAFMSTTKSSNYYNKALYYKVVSDYKQARLRGSSLTVNDLVYEPSIDGHRLFVRNNCCFYNKVFRGKIYYRSLSEADATSWWLEHSYYNNIFIHTGPSYTKENLYND